MRLYFAGNFTVTDEVVNEQRLEKVLGEDYHRLCTFFYPKAADVIVQNIKPDIKKKIFIDETGLDTKNHPALQTELGEQNEKNQKGYQKEQENRKRNNNKRKTKKRVKLKKRNKIVQ